MQWVPASGNRKLRAMVALGVCSRPCLWVGAWSPCEAGAAWVCRKSLLSAV